MIMAYDLLITMTGIVYTYFKHNLFTCVHTVIVDTDITRKCLPKEDIPKIENKKNCLTWICQQQKDQKMNPQSCIS